MAPSIGPSAVASAKRPSPPIGRFVAAGLGTCVLALGGFGVYAGVVGSSDMLHPARSLPKAAPDSFGAAFQPVAFQGAGGVSLSGWYVPAATPTKAAVLVLHGHGSNKGSAYRKYGAWLHSRFNVFLYDARAHGESTGDASTLGYYEREDARAALQLLRERGNERIGLLGESMGGATAISAAAKEKSVLAVVNDCAFDSLHDAVAPRATLRGYPLPDYVAESVIWTASLRTRAPLAEADPVRVVGQIAPRPLLIIHGLKDINTTTLNAQKLYDAAGQPKSIWWTPETGHAESYRTHAAEYQRRVLAFFAAALTVPGETAAPAPKAASTLIGPAAPVPAKPQASTGPAADQSEPSASVHKVNAQASPKAAAHAPQKPTGRPGAKPAQPAAAGTKPTAP